ncbi:SDR family NAD(P)-dependent oxidoreductase [Pseudofrankia sp. BMG5.37]|nr:SDR family NAD(P)-dependent oxidoreductase [Pseudofrankia sp. BMG5.37]MDT3446051.1 SDR family NAD(P)-dependent oxidoreductase [Pseudofrankia sp. BMG5.37]
MVRDGVVPRLRSFVRRGRARSRRPRRGDRVAATARGLGSLADLVEANSEAILPLRLDVTDKEAVGAAVKAAYAHFGRLDIVVNNAGYGLVGAVEELDEQAIRGQLETNFFGALWVTQAVLPYLREQGSGHIVQISSVSGLAAFPTLGGYNASKWALEGLSEALAQEVASFGIAVTLVEPGLFGTDWAGSSAAHATPDPVYDQMRQAMVAMNGQAEVGDPAAAAAALLKVVDAENPPLRVLFGSQPAQVVKYIYEQRLKTWADWEPVARQAQGS